MSRKTMLVMLAVVVALPFAAVAQEADTSKPAETPAPEEQQPPAQALTVEAVVCSGVEERMPIDTLTEFNVDAGQVFVWMRITGAADSTSVTVRWSHGETVMAEVELPVKSPSWRTWSSKNVLPSWAGNWDVKILDSEGDILKALSFNVGGP
ncbi:MAG: DUF2914 domain-containing protein [candidate division Zixibacteria bacterium]|nr:DUF2914 domain-containing protein [candidate division Zixibacteria bacterium]